MAEHFTVLTEQLLDGAHLINKPEYEKTCADRADSEPFGQVFDAIKKA
ncbi:hypothetical protein [Paenibacillus sp. N3.4]|nr:hypothetical protein [Paenibacillus sp. N3.4]